MGYRDYSTAKGHIVDSSGHGDFTTITEALAAATSGQTIFVRPGTYTENLTGVPGVNIVAYSTIAGILQVTVVGKLTLTAAGTYEFGNINFQTNSDFAISCTGASQVTAQFFNCGLTGQNNTILQYSNSNGNSKIDIYSCNMDLKTTGIAYFTHSAAGSLLFTYTIGSNSGGSTTASTQSGGTLFINYSAFLAPYSNSGGSTSVNAQFSIFNTSAQNATAITHNSTVANGPRMSNCYFESGTATAVSIGAGAILRLNACTINSTNTSITGGAGTLEQSGISSLATDTGTLGTTTVTSKTLFPYAASAASASGSVRGTASFDSTKFTVTNGFVTTNVTGATSQVLTSGTAATYTTPANCKWIKIRMIGGGGGGAGTGTASVGNGGAGTASTWSGGSLSAGGGAGGTTTTAGAGGTSSNGSVNLTGGTGGPRWNNTIASIGGYGGNGAFGGGGSAGEANGGAGGAGTTNTGGGGGGGGSTATTVGSGAGGGSGGYLEKIIVSPAASYTYTVGAAGAAGTAGTSGVAGGAGGSGLIIVDEYYI